jgi:hypothetical protein
MDGPGASIMRITCVEPDCGATVPDHYWGKVRAEGWLFLKDGRAYCPAHLPDWINPWRRRNETRKP